jgi:hypothetical protein
LYFFAKKWFLKQELVRITVLLNPLWPIMTEKYINTILGIEALESVYIGIPDMINTS